MGGMCMSFPAVIGLGRTRDVSEIYGIDRGLVKSRGRIESMHNLNFRLAPRIGIL
jgi:hypothetical protein